MIMKNICVNKVGVQNENPTYCMWEQWKHWLVYLFSKFDLPPSQPIRVMLSVVSLPNHTFSWAGFVL